MQKDTIRDLSTGQIFALNNHEDQQPAATALEDRTQHFTDFASGRQLSLEEFEAALGLRKPVNLFPFKVKIIVDLLNHLSYDVL